MSIIIAKCRFCGKVFHGSGTQNERKPSVQIITCKDCRGKLPKDDYIERYLEK